MSKTTTVHVHHAFCIFLCRPCPTTTWNDQILSWLENGNGKAINFAFSLWIRTWSPLFSSNLTSLLSSDWVTWYKGEKVLKDAKSISQRRFHWRRRCRIVTSLIGSLSNNDGDGYENVTLIRQMWAIFFGKEKESCCLVFPSSTKREIRHFHVVVVQRRLRKVQKSVMHVQSCCFANLTYWLFAVLIAVVVVVV